jgi:hypothetical protein
MDVVALSVWMLWALPSFAADVELSPGADVRTRTLDPVAGDVFTFRDGTYILEDEWLISGTGTAAAPIVFRAARNARPVIRLTTAGGRIVRILESEHVVLQGLIFEQDDERYSEATPNGIRIDDSSDIRIDDCEIRHVGAAAINLAGNNRRIEITGNRIHDTYGGNGIFAGCNDASCWLQDSIIAGNLIYDVKSRDEELRVDGIHLAPGAQDNRLLDNVVADINRSGIRVHSTEYGSRNLIEGNVIWDVGASGLWLGGAALVRNNIVFDSGGPALYSENNREALENLVVSHNTLLRSAGPAARLRGWDGPAGLVFSNNVLANPIGEGLDAPDGIGSSVLLSGNVVTGSVFGLEPGHAGIIPGGGFTDFVDVASLDFYPRSNSILREVADPSGSAFVPDLDFNGFARNGDRPTVGALEYVNPVNPGWQIDLDFKTFEDSRLQDEFGQRGCCRKDASAASGFLAPLVLLAGWGRRRRSRTRSR